MQIATWNVNSLTVRIGHVIDWLEKNPQIDVLCLQELKQSDDKFPLAELTERGYHAAFFGQKTYNGVAIIAKTPLENVVKNNPLFEDVQSRIITASTTVNGVPLRIMCVYVPNGQSVDSDKYHYKLAWLQSLETFVSQEMQRSDNFVITGDFNIAPTDADVAEPEKWQGKILVSDKERAAFNRFLALPLTDAIESHHPAASLFSWWDYRAACFRRNHGARIDHILCSSSLKIRDCNVDKEPRKWEKPSDHTPVWAHLET